MQGNLVEQIQYSINNELVSSDIVGTSAPSIYDSNASIVAKNGKSVVLYVWYDNEYGYSKQVINLTKKIANIKLQRLPKPIE
jgi:glyceraldehyde 3-phosphate dehydrogenase